MIKVQKQKNKSVTEPLERTENTVGNVAGAVIGTGVGLSLLGAGLKI